MVCERCGLDLKVNLILEEPKESKHRKNSELQIEMKVQNIIERINKAKAEGAEAVVQKAETVGTDNDKTAKATSGGQTNNAQQNGTNSANQCGINDAKSAHQNVGFRVAIYSDASPSRAWGDDSIGSENS